MSDNGELIAFLLIRRERSATGLNSWLEAVLEVFILSEISFDRLAGRIAAREKSNEFNLSGEAL